MRGGRGLEKAESRRSGRRGEAGMRGVRRGGSNGRKEKTDRQTNNKTTHKKRENT